MVCKKTPKMIVQIAPEVKKKFPHVKLGVVTVRGTNNRKENAEIMQALREAEEAIRERYEIEKIAQVPKIKDWRDAYRSFGSKERSSVEALTRTALQGKELPDINPLVNLYNLVSLKHTIAADSNDLDAITGTIHLTFTEKDVLYCDAKGLSCRSWNDRKGNKSKVTENTTNACFVLEGLENTTKEELRQATLELKHLIEKYCGGIVEEKIIIANPLPDYFRWDDFKKRSEKLAEIREMGMNPYPHKYEPTHAIRDLNSKYEKNELADSEAASEGKTPESCVAGRVMLFRAMGKNAFAHIQEEGARVQVMFNRDTTKVVDLPEGESAIKFVEKKIDLGDIIGIKGHLFRTQKGELTLFAKEVTLLTKSLLPLPDKHHGLADKGTRYRKRWLDLITNKEAIDTFKMRSKILTTIRKTMDETNFLEVENPVLQNMYGGAEARPFVSHLNALNQEMYLRIALELPLKKLIVGGFERVYELAKVFRNEGIDRTHNPEFTMIEAYAAYWDYNDVMDFIEKIFEDVAIALFGTTQIGMRKDKEGNEHQIDLKRPWKRISMKNSIQEYGNINVDELSDEQMRKILSEKTDDDTSNTPRGKLIAMLFEELVEHHLIQPTHITDHPIETTPLCKLHRNPKERAEQIVERFETFILGFEFCNAYTELNDPEIQRQLLVEQNEKREAGDEEASPLDEEFLEAICQGMPPTGGFGIGIDRLTMLFTGETSIRDVVFFPLMRPGE